MPLHHPVTGKFISREAYEALVAEFGTKFEGLLDPRPIQQAVEKATFRNLGHAAAKIRKTARGSIKSKAGPSRQGTPPHTRPKRRQLPNAIVYAYDRTNQRAVVGPRKSVAGESGHAHEFGGSYRGAEYPERSFMGPALEENLSSFAGSWAGSVGA